MKWKENFNEDNVSIFHYVPFFTKLYKCVKYLAIVVPFW
jgi:hypothetical protein